MPLRPGTAGWEYAAYLMEDVIENFGAVVLEEGSPVFVGAKECTNNTAELTAIVEAMIWALECTDISMGVVHILYDSKYAAENIMAVTHPTSNKRLVYLGRIVREKLLGKVDLKWTWVRGHQGNPGNERADRLADAGRETWSDDSRASTNYQGRAIFLMGS